MRVNSTTFARRPPSDRAEISQYRPELNTRLAKAIHACIEPDVNKRCPSMSEFLRQIRKLSDAAGG